MRKLLLVTVAMTLGLTACGDDDDDVADTPTTEEGTSQASVTMASPSDGTSVARRFDVAFATEGFELEPAGEVRDGAGHLHVIVDAGCLEAGQVIPKDATHVHFGKGQSAGQLFLEPGEHELCLQAGDGAHAALDLTDEITVNVDGSKPYVTLGVPPGETVTSPLALTMEASALTVEPAGPAKEGAGHFHLMIDTQCAAPGEVIPKDAQHVHYGDGSTQAQVELAPGEHTLCLQMGDGAHTALDVTHVVSVVVT